jgi:hypothetical protein
VFRHADNVRDQGISLFSFSSLYIFRMQIYAFIDRKYLMSLYYQLSCHLVKLSISSGGKCRREVSAKQAAAAPVTMPTAAEAAVLATPIAANAVSAAPMQLSPPQSNFLVQRGKAYAALLGGAALLFAHQNFLLSSFLLSSFLAGKLLNEATGRLIDIGKGTYQKLLAQGYEVDERAGTITPPSGARPGPGAEASVRSAGGSSAGGRTRRRLSAGG